jgi:hypothetical protein
VSNNNYGIYVHQYNDDNTIWNNQFIDNGEYNNQSAYQYYNSYNNNWNLGEVGNYWSDFEDNPGFPFNYTIPGNGNGVDYYPFGAFSVTIISPEFDAEVGPDQVLINISSFGEVDKIWYNTTNGIEYYDGPVYVNTSDIPWEWEWYSWPVYDDVKRYELNVWANNTLGFMDYESVDFYADVTRPNVTIISPENNEVFDTPEVLINLSAWDNFGVDTVQYSLKQQNWPYEYLVNNETYTEPFSVNLPNGYYNLNVSVNDTSGVTNSDYVLFTVNATEPEIIFNSPQNGEIYQSSQILINLSAYSDFGIDTIWLNNSGEIYTEPFYKHFSEFDYNGNWYLPVCVNDSAGNEECETVYFDVQLPDLTVIDIEFGGDTPENYTPQAGDELTLEVTIKNIGNLSVDGFNYSYNFNYEDRELTSESFNGRGFDPGEERTLELTHTYALAGDYTFYFELDLENNVDEFNETNNIGLETYFVDGIPDLISNLISFEQDAENPYLVIFNIDISNYGTIWVDDFDYNVYFGDGEGSGGSISENIQPGETYPFTLTHEYSSLQEYNIFFDVYPYGMDDFNESNNFFETIINLEEEICVKGDVNLDGEIDVSDIVLLVSSILGETELNELQLCAADYNSDGIIDVLDIIDLVNEILDGEEATRAEIFNKIKSMLSQDREVKNALMDDVFKDLKKSRKNSDVNQIEPVKMKEVKQVIIPALMENIIEGKKESRIVYNRS